MENEMSAEEKAIDKVWAAEDWLVDVTDDEGRLGLRADMTDEEMAEMAEKMEADAIANIPEVDEIDGLYEELIARRDRMQCKRRLPSWGPIATAR